LEKEDLVKDCCHSTFQKYLLFQENVCKKAELQRNLATLIDEPLRMIEDVVEMLNHYECIDNNVVTLKGRCVLMLQDIDGIAAMDAWYKGLFSDKDINVIAAMLSCFYPFKIELDDVRPNEMYFALAASGFSCMQPYTYELVFKWCHVTNVEEAVTFVKELPIDLGEFVKCVLFVVNTSSHFAQVAELEDNVRMQHILSAMPSVLLKFVVTNQSLYV